MPRISYVRPEDVTEPDLVGLLQDSRIYGTPRPESQSIRAHVPAVLRTFAASWQQVFREGCSTIRSRSWHAFSSPRAWNAAIAPANDHTWVPKRD